MHAGSGPEAGPTVASGERLHIALVRSARVEKSILEAAIGSGGETPGAMQVPALPVSLPQKQGFLKPSLEAAV
jgi:hypothetical protein